MRPTIRVFAEAMEKKLQRDDNSKVAWELEDPRKSLDNLFDEVIELKHAMIRYRLTGNQEDEIKVMSECCDVANSAMIVFSQLHPEAKGNSRGY